MEILLFFLKKMVQMLGWYLIVGGQKYIVCDPTYIGAPMGRTMPGMDNNSAKVIALKR